MTINISKTERFLVAFHNANPGITTRAIANLPVFKEGRLFSSTYECLATEIPNDREPRTLLDLACGDGFLLSQFAERRHSSLALIGVDISHGELEAARNRLGHTVSLMQGRAQALMLTSKSIDYVVCHMALMLMDDVESVVAEVHRVLKKGAIFATIVSTRPPPSPIFDAYLELLSKHPREAMYRGMKFGDRRLRDREGITEIMSKSFESVQIQDLMIRRQISPSALCTWLEDNYDYHMLEAESQRSLNSRFIEFVENQCGDDGAVEFRNSFYLVTAVAA